MAQTSFSSTGSQFAGLCLPGVKLADEKSRSWPRQAGHFYGVPYGVMHARISKRPAYQGWMCNSICCLVLVIFFFFHKCRYLVFVAPVYFCPQCHSLVSCSVSFPSDPRCSVLNHLCVCVRPHSPRAQVCAVPARPEQVGITAPSLRHAVFSVLSLCQLGPSPLPSLQVAGPMCVAVDTHCYII